MMFRFGRSIAFAVGVAKGLLIVVSERNHNLVDGLKFLV
jgi:hypothetical protein